MTFFYRSFRLSPFVWAILCAVGFVFAAYTLFASLLNDPESRILAANLVIPSSALLASFALFAASWRLKQVSRRLSQVWWLFGLAQFALAAGDWAWTIYEMVLKVDPFPSPADGLYLLCYPFFFIGVLRLPAYRQSILDWLKVSIDIIIVVVASVVVYWNFLLGPLVAAETYLSLELILTLAYPVGDLLLLWGTVFALYRLSDYSGRSPLWLIAVGLVVFVATDSLYAYRTMLDVYQSGDWLDLGYVLSYALFGMGGVLQFLDASKEGCLVPHIRSERASRSAWTIYLPYAWVLGAFVMMLLGRNRDLPMSEESLIVFLGGITLLVLARQVLTMRENDLLSKDLERAVIKVQQQSAALERARHEMQVEIYQRVQAEKQHAHDSMHDVLTGLPNRTMCLQMLNYAAEKRRLQPGYRYAVLCLDLDSFKVINDSLGHQVGDRLLVEMAQILRGAVSACDMVARLGGDEFVLLIENVTSGEQVLSTADQLLSELANPVDVDGVSLFVSVSIGILLDVDVCECPEDLLRDADLAMYHAKANGKGRYEVFTPSMRDSAISRLELENDLRRAVENQQLVLHYQPVLILPERRLAGFEALVRWNHPIRGLLSSGEFIPMAEETGLILKLGEWVLNEACRQLNEWRTRQPESAELRMSVNISGKQLKQPNFVELVTHALRSNSLPGYCLILEITESICLDAFDQAMVVLRQLQDLGVEIQIDDFGTGYSSLSYLNQMPVRSIKIDRAFIQSLNQEGSNGPEIIRGILSMIKDLGIKAVAEGIENERQLVILNDLECAYGQGYYLARPMDLKTVELWMERQRHSPGD